MVKYFSVWNRRIAVECARLESAWAERSRGFESLRFRQVLHSAKLKDVASAQNAPPWDFFATFKGFF